MLQVFFLRGLFGEVLGLVWEKDTDGLHNASCIADMQANMHGGRPATCEQGTQRVLKIYSRLQENKLPHTLQSTPQLVVIFFVVLAPSSSTRDW